VILAFLPAAACSRPRDNSHQEGSKAQIEWLFCKPICKPDAAKPGETGETEQPDRDVICPVRRGRCTRQDCLRRQRRASYGS